MAPCSFQIAYHKKYLTIELIISYYSYIMPGHNHTAYIHSKIMYRIMHFMHTWLSYLSYNDATSCSCIVIVSIVSIAVT